MSLFSIEPSADLRTAAKALRELYVALRASGFTQQEALTLLAALLVGQSGPKGDPST